jgi:CheY-like chemotaxis protein
MAHRILIVDDDVKTTGGLRRLFEHHEYDVQEVNDSRMALDQARSFQPHVVILDYLMPQLHGGDVAWQLASDPMLKATKIVICSAASRSEVARALPPCRIPILEKPVDFESLLRLVQTG